MEQYDVKITVAKKLSVQDVFGSSPPKISKELDPVCTRLNEGDTFIAQKGACPQGFCGTAFADIHRDITHLRFGGNYPWMQEQGVAYSCCTDGLRPVVFRLERMK